MDYSIYLETEKADKFLSELKRRNIKILNTSSDVCGKVIAIRCDSITAEKLNDYLDKNIWA